MIIITTLNRELAKLIRTGQLSEKELSEVYQDIFAEYSESKKCVDV